MNNKKRIILEILATFESELKEQEIKGNITNIKYYEKFNIKDINFDKGLFIVTLEDEQKRKFYELYANNPENKIISINSEGKTTIYPENLEEYIGEEITLEDLIIAEKKETKNLKGISSKTNPKEIENYIDNQKEEKQSKLNSEELIEQDLEELEISSYREINDPNLEEQLEIKFIGATEKGMAFSRKLGGFVLVEKVDGKFRRIEEVEVSEPTIRKVISINENGEQIEEKVPHALMKTNNEKKELSITIGDYGYIETATVDVLPCNLRVEMQLREEGEGMNGRRNKDLENLGEIEGTEAIHEIAHEYKELEEELESQKENFTDEEIEELLEISKEEGIKLIELEMMIIEAAREAEVSIEEFLNYLKEVENGSIEQKIEYSVEEIKKEKVENQQEI